MSFWLNLNNISLFYWRWITLGCWFKTIHYESNNNY